LAHELRHRQQLLVLTRASWQFDQVNSPGDYSGWNTQIATDSAAMPIILAQQTDGDTHI
jgi:hypothetical protein